MDDRCGKDLTESLFSMYEKLRTTVGDLAKILTVFAEELEFAQRTQSIREQEQRAIDKLRQMALVRSSSEEYNAACDNAKIAHETCLALPVCHLEDSEQRLIDAVGEVIGIAESFLKKTKRIKPLLGYLYITDGAQSMHESESPVNSTPQEVPITRKRCVGPKCQKMATKNGLCIGHDLQRSKGESLAPLSRFCSKEGCKDISVSLGLCAKHYHLQRRNLPRLE